MRYYRRNSTTAAREEHVIAATPLRACLGNQCRRRVLHGVCRAAHLSALRSGTRSIAPACVARRVPLAGADRRAADRRVQADALLGLARRRPDQVPLGRSARPMRCPCTHTHARTPMCARANTHVRQSFANMGPTRQRPVGLRRAKAGLRFARPLRAVRPRGRGRADARRGPAVHRRNLRPALQAPPARRAEPMPVRMPRHGWATPLRRPSTADGESLASLQRRINESTPLLEVSDLKIVSKAYFDVRAPTDRQIDRRAWMGSRQTDR